MLIFIFRIKEKEYHVKRHPEYERPKTTWVMVTIIEKEKATFFAEGEFTN
ncbi:hypothetical protein [Lachnobacterium bovis]|nr:hypothetical protein [Lachnobacterium bovis]